MGAPSDSRAGIRVCARFRPQNKLEHKHEAVECVHLEDGTAARINSSARGLADEHTFTFDRVFGTTSTQLDVYNATAKPLVESALRGYSCTCFVYGQTGSGKTFSMEGVPGDTEFEGIIPRVMADIYAGIQGMQAELEFIVRASYLEIYMEKIRDLLKPSSTNLSVRESRERGVWVAGSTEICCASAEEMQSVMRLGGANRVISSTRMNSESSRSHSVFIITIEQRNTATGSMKSGKLFLVDLAGSEKVGKTHAKGQTLKEAQHINKSLSALGGVMNALTSGHSNAHIPYRDSKLTRLLQDSLGGNSETTLLVCASSSSYNSEETVSTLRFGSRAKNIKNKPKVNQERTVAEYKILLAEKDKRIAELETKLRDALEGQVTSDGETESKAMREATNQELKAFMAKVEQLEDDQASKASEISSLEERCAELAMENKELHQKELEVASMTSRNDEFMRKLTFVESELLAKIKECADLNRLLERRRAKPGTGSALPSPGLDIDQNSSPPVQPTISEDSEMDAAGLSHVPNVPLPTHVSMERGRADSSVMENELLRQQLSAKSHELEICTKRIEELTKGLVDSRNVYDAQITTLQDKLREYDFHVRGFMEISEHGDQATQLDSLVKKTRMLRSVRGGGGGATLMKPVGSTTDASATTALPLLRSGSVSTAALHNKWKQDEEVFPVAPVNMESEVVKRLLQSMPEKGREKITKWLGFVLEGRDIRANFHPELSIEGVNEEINRDMRRLIVPLLKNRQDLEVQSYVRTRYVRISDLKITLEHKHKDTVHLEDAAGDSMSDDYATEDDSLPRKPTKQWATDHRFYGPKGDASSVSVLHASRVLVPSKDRFTSEPVDLQASALESKNVLEAAAAASASKPPPSGHSTITASAESSSSSAPNSGGVFGRFRSKSTVGSMLGDVKNLLSARYHKNYVHENALCDGCGMSPIVGGKWRCNTCESYELCDGCYTAGLHGFEVSNELCRRIEQLAVQKHRLLAEYPELFELFRRHICHDNVLQFRRIVEWLSAIVSGARTADMYHKMIVKSGLHPEIRARLVAQLGALASERTDISLKTEWVVEKTLEEEEAEAAAASDGSQSSDTGESVPDESESDQSTPTSAFAPSDVRLETLRMFITDASSSQARGKASPPASMADLLHPTSERPELSRASSQSEASSAKGKVSATAALASLTLSPGMASTLAE